MLQQIAFTSFNIYEVNNGEDYDDSYVLTFPFSQLNMVGIILFISMHWLFTSHHLKVAVLFRLSYQENDIV